jgi:hypothetical protein
MMAWAACHGHAAASRKTSPSSTKSLTLWPTIGATMLRDFSNQ